MRLRRTSVVPKEADLPQWPEWSQDEDINKRVFTTHMNCMYWIDFVESGNKFRFDKQFLVTLVQADPDAYGPKIICEKIVPKRQQATEVINDMKARLEDYVMEEYL